MKYLNNKEKVSFCHNEKCVHAFGRNAIIIAIGLGVMFICFGAASLLQNN